MPQDRNLEKYVRILNRLRGGKKVSKEEIKHFLTYTSDFDEKKLTKLRAKLSTEEGIKNITDEDLATIMDQGRKALTTDQYKEDTLSLAKEAEQGRVSEAVATGLNTLLAGADVATSLQQIKASKDLAASNVHPSRPSVPGRDPYLQQALNQAQQGSFDQSRALAPAQLQIQDQYLSDLQNAKIASTGQAGQYGILAQEAANRRNRASADLVPLADQIKREQQGRYDDLVRTRMGETQNIYENQAQMYPYDLHQYNLTNQTAGELGATGRSNLRGSLANLGQFTSNIAGQVAGNRYDKLYNRMSAYGDTAAKAAVTARKELDNRFGTLTRDDSPYWEQAYGN